MLSALSFPRTRSLVLASAILMAGVAYPVPAHAGTGYCNRAVCFWDDKNYEDTTTQTSAAWSNFGSVGFHDKASSVVNATGQHWRIYEDSNYEGKSVCLPPGKRISNLGDYSFNDKASSARPRTSC